MRGWLVGGVCGVWGGGCQARWVDWGGRRDCGKGLSGMWIGRGMPWIIKDGGSR